MALSQRPIDPAGRTTKGSRSTAIRFLVAGYGHPERAETSAVISCDRHQRAGARDLRRSGPPALPNPSKVDVERFGDRFRIALKALHDDGQQEEDAHTGAENHPAFEIVQEALGVLDPVGVHQNPDHADPERVHENGDRRGGKQDHHLVPDRPVIEHAEDVGERLRIGKRYLNPEQASATWSL